MQDVANIVHTGSGNAPKAEETQNNTVTFPEKVRNADDWLQRNLW